MISVIPAQPEPSNGVCRPRFFNCFWDIPTTMERYVHVTSKSLVDAVQPFEQSHGNVDILTPFWCKNGVQNRACCQSRTASSYLHTVRMSIFLGFSSNSCTAFTGDLLVTWTLRSIAVGMSQRHALSDGSGCEGVTEVMEPHIPRIPCTSISETLQFS